MPRSLWLRGILPVLGGLMLWAALGYNLYFHWGPGHSYTSWHMGFWPHRDISRVFLIDLIDLIDLISLVIGVVLMFAFAAVRPAFFRGETLNRDTPTLVPEDLGTEVRLFRVDESGAADG